MAYDFSTLDDHDFEKFTRDILNATFGLDLQDFKIGRDKGIDLRYSSPFNRNSIVVQAKHWLKSGYQRLFETLRREELPKIQLLSPERYFLVTSVSLSAQNKDELFQLLSPFVNSCNDILGKEDLNKYLGSLPDIEKKWYKLWLTSTVVLQQILHNGVLGTNEFVADKILRSTQRYVPCSSYDLAFEILKSHKYLLITGQPGVGKTTLAYYLTYHYLANGFQLLYVDSDIHQATRLLSNDPAVKQIVFFDDFLGETYLEISNPKTTESAFVLFLERIIHSENKFLILTTRTTIYNNAIGKYEKIERMKVDMARKEVVLEQYSFLDKARILYKHIYYSELPEKLKGAFFLNKNYWKLIEHNNYNPRLIEFVTSKWHIPHETQIEYWGFVEQTFNNPEAVWKHFYQFQLSEEERLLLHTVFAQNYHATAEDTKGMFNCMLDYEVSCNNLRAVLSPFKTACKRLLDGTLKKDVFFYDKKERFSFINPSLSDFLKHYFISNDEERKKLLLAASHLEQFEHYEQVFLGVTSFNPKKDIAEIKWFVGLLIDRAPSLLSYHDLKREVNRGAYIQLRIAALVSQLGRFVEGMHHDIVALINNALIRYSIESINEDSRELYIKVLVNVSPGSAPFIFVVSNWNRIIDALFLACRSESSFEGVKDLFFYYNMELSAYLRSTDGGELLFDALNDLANSLTEELLSDECYSVLSEKDWISLKERVVSERAEFFAKFDLDDESYEEDKYFLNIEVESLIQDNISRLEASALNELNNSQLFAMTTEADIVKEVELLFAGEFDEAFVKNKAHELQLPF